MSNHFWQNPLQQQMTTSTYRYSINDLGLGMYYDNQNNCNKIWSKLWFV